MQFAGRSAHLAGLIGFGVVLLVAGRLAAGDLPPPPVHPNGGALWQVVGGQCLPGMKEKNDPAPCTAVRSGYALLKDRNGVAQYLLTPDEDITGIEDARVLTGPNYFAEAWGARAVAAAKLGRPLGRGWTAVTVNSQYGRTQDLLHLHIDCLGAGAVRDLAKISAGTAWSRDPIRIAGHDYFVRRIDGETLSVNPFRLLADEMPGAKANMGAWTLAVAGATFDGKPGFFILAGKADPLHGEFASAEELQDHACTAAKE